jgi:hypothetical protein
VWPTVWRMSLTVCISYLATLPTAISADLTPPPPDAVAPVAEDIGTQFEARFGVFDHGVGSAERNTVDINGSIVTPRLQTRCTGICGLLSARFQLGGAANLASRTSFGDCACLTSSTISPSVISVSATTAFRPPRLNSM